MAAMTAQRESGSPSVRAPGLGDIGWVPSAVIGVIAAVVAFVAMRAWLAGTNDPDSMASVLYFQRIAAGRHLEVTVLTTPKPLLTAVFGLTWGLAHDWRAIVWETILVHAIAVALAVRLASRVGGMSAGIFVGAALIASAPELAEVAQANSVPWALAGWLAAGVAVTATPRRFGIAGAMLLLAGLARIETWLILAIATLALIALTVPAIRARAPSGPSPRTVLPLMVAWLAVPIQLVHDYLLTGNALYWLTVPGAYTALVKPNLQPVSMAHFAHVLWLRYTGMPLLVLLAAVGVAHLLMTRRWAVLVGLAALVGGVLLLIGLLAVRGTFVSDRYFEEPELGLLFAAGIGIGAIAAWLRRLAPPPLRPAGMRIAGAAAAIAAALVISLPGPLSPTLEDRFSAQHRASSDLEAAMPALRKIMSSVKGPAPPAPPAANGFTAVDPRLATIYVPRPLQRRIAVELDIELTRLADPTVASKISPAADILMAGQYVFHDANVDLPKDWFTGFEIQADAALGELRLVVLAHKPDAYWLLRVERPTVP